MRYFAGRYAEDLRQAGRVRLYAVGARLPQSQWLRAALHAMRDELRRLTEWNKHTGLAPHWISLEDAPETSCSRYTLDQLAGAGQALEAVERRFPGWVAAILESDTSAEAAARMGVSYSRASQRVREIVQFAESLHHANNAKTKTPKRRRAHRERAADSSASGR